MKRMELVKGYLIKRYTLQKEIKQWPVSPQDRYKTDYWITKDGRYLDPREMDNGHLLNAIHLLHVLMPIVKDTYETYDFDNHIIYGPYCKGLPRKHRKKYLSLWKEFRIYMIMRQEVVFRKLKLEE